MTATLTPPNARPRAAAPKDPLIDGVLRGDRVQLARAITLVESNAIAHRPRARDILRAVSGHSHIARRVGISGPPGAGKSTFIEALGNHLCDLGHRVAVLAVDPSSSLSGGSILGDRTRMTTLSHRETCFIRPSPSRGTLGGVARKTRETITLCEAAGFDVVIIETVGVGQSEIAVRGMVDCLILLLLAGAGDELQGMKKGILETGDVLVINKADGTNEGPAASARAALARIIHLLPRPNSAWNIPVLAISSLTPEGPSKVWAEAERFFGLLEQSGQLHARRGEQTVAWWKDLVAQEVQMRFMADPGVARLSTRLEHDVASGRVPPSLAAEELLQRFDTLFRS